VRWEHLDLSKLFKHETLLTNMKKSQKNKQKCDCNKCGCGTCSCGGAVYGLGFIGAAIYYISNATGFWMGVLGFLKALVWPAFLIYESLKALGI
jgi:hypothetical protein